MIKVTLPSHPDGMVPLGAFCDFVVEGGEPATETRLFVQHSQILYLKPLSDWTAQPQQRHFLEAPGPYRLHVQWRGPSGEGWTTLDFRIGEPVAGEQGVQMIRIDDQTRMWAPTVGESHFLSHHEETTLALLRELVRPGTVAYDIGAHLGLYASHLGRLVGDAGTLYCIEANPVCVSFLRANLELNGVRNYTIIPVALAGDVGTCGFTINYFNLFLGIGGTSPVPSKVGHEIAVGTTSLDDLIRTFALRPPTFIKMDIEGGEVVAVPGMRATLERWRPTLLMELHGCAAARPAIAAFDGLGYRFREAAGGQTFAGWRELWEWFPDQCLQVIGYPD